MKEYAITKTIERGGIVTGPETLFPAQPRRVFLQINVVGSGCLYCSVGPGPSARVGVGIYIDSDNPLQLQVPVIGEIKVVPGLAEVSAGSAEAYDSVTYSAAEGLS